MNRFLVFAFAALLIFSLAPNGSAGELEGQGEGVEATASEEAVKIRNMTGVLTSIDPKNHMLTVKNRRWEKDFYFDDETKVKEGRKFLTQEILEPGLNVKVAYREINGQREAQIVRLRK